MTRFGLTISSTIQNGNSWSQKFSAYTTMEIDNQLRKFWDVEEVTESSRLESTHQSKTEE